MVYELPDLICQETYVHYVLRGARRLAKGLTKDCRGELSRILGGCLIVEADFLRGAPRPCKRLVRRWLIRSCVNVFGFCLEHVLRPSWISARMRS